MDGRGASVPAQDTSGSWHLVHQYDGSGSRPEGSDKQQAPNWADVQIGDSAIVYEAPNREGLPERGGPARFLDIGEIGASAR